MDEILKPRTKYNDKRVRT